MRKFPLMAQILDFTCGAVSLASVLRAFGHAEADEARLSAELGTLRVGFTPPENVVEVAKAYGHRAEMSTGAALEDLRRSVARPGATIITWWDEDAGHYSVVENLRDNSITLMDPWLARDGTFNEMAIETFMVHWRARGSRLIYIGFETEPPRYGCPRSVRP